MAILRSVRASFALVDSSSLVPSKPMVVGLFRGVADELARLSALSPLTSSDLAAPFKESQGHAATAAALWRASDGKAQQPECRPRFAGSILTLKSRPWNFLVLLLPPGLWASASISLRLREGQAAFHKLWQTLAGTLTCLFLLRLIWLAPTLPFGFAISFSPGRSMPSSFLLLVQPFSAACYPPYRTYQKPYGLDVHERKTGLGTVLALRAFC